jgi:hypothetical protein
LDFSVSLRHKLSQLLLSGDSYILWGLGGDAWRLFQECPEINGVLDSGVVLLADQTFAGSQFRGHTILSPSEISNYQISVFLMPAFSGTRNTMVSYALRNGFNDRIIDPYA